MKQGFKLLITAGLGGLLLNGCLPAGSVHVGYGYPSRRVTVVQRRPVEVRTYRLPRRTVIVQPQRQIRIQSLPRGHAYGHGKHDNRRGHH